MYKEFATVVLLVLSCLYAYKIAVAPLDKTWLEVVIGVTMTFAGFVTFVTFDVMETSSSIVDTVIQLSWSFIYAFAITGLPMILGQIEKAVLTEHHHQIGKASTRDAREAWRQDGDEEETVAEQQG